MEKRTLYALLAVIAHADWVIHLGPGAGLRRLSTARLYDAMNSGVPGSPSKGGPPRQA